MRRFLLALTGLLTVFFSCKARDTRSTTDGNAKSLLWKISGNGLKHSSYVFGTIHLICAEDYLWTSTMKESLQQCKEICFEMDMDDPTVMMQVATGMTAQDGKNLNQYFDEDEYKLVERFVKDSLGMDLLLFQKMKPAALQSLFATRSLTCHNPVSYEANLMEEAKNQGKDVTGLEEPAEQIALLNSLPEDSVVKQLVAMASDYTKEREEFSEMIKAYRNQDLEKLQHIIEESDEIKNELATFLYDRNKNWIPRMVERMKRNTVFFAVGAGHLPGTNGVLQLLRQQGYTVEPIR